MADGLNRVMLLGALGADPELRYAQSGTAILKMRLATSETYFDKDKQKCERTEWHRCVVFGKRAEGLGKFLRKGMTILVEGRLHTSNYDDKEGQKRYMTEIVADNIIVPPRGKGAQEETGGGVGAQASIPAEQGTGEENYGSYGADDDLPF